MIKATVVVNQPRAKADKTATLGFSTTEEVNSVDYLDLSELALEKETVTIIILKNDEYIEGITQLGQELLTQNGMNGQV